MSFNPIQLFDSDASNFSYILVAPNSGHADIIDPIDHHCERDVRHLERLGLELVYVLATRPYGDPSTRAGRLCRLTGALNAVHIQDSTSKSGVALHDRAVIRFGIDEEIRVISTPGLTAGSLSYAWRGNVFTGDTLLIDDHGSIDSESRCPDALYSSIKEKLFTLPDQTRLWPGHDHKGQTVSTIGWEKRHDVRLAARSREDFIRSALSAGISQGNV